MNRPFDLDAARRRTRCKTSEPAPSAFSTAAQREWLTPRGFTLLQRAITDGHGLTEDLAHEVARALRGWAANRGATHVAFRVHPLAGEPDRVPAAAVRPDGRRPRRRHARDRAGRPRDVVGRGHAVARRPRRQQRRGGAAACDSVGPGRLTWDPASLAYIRVARGGAVLCLPSVLASAEGEALDHRLPLMRSEDALAAAAARALRVLDDISAHRVQPTVALTRGFEFADQGPRSPRTRGGSRLRVRDRRRARARPHRRGRAHRRGGAHRPAVLGGHRERPAGGGARGAARRGAAVRLQAARAQRRSGRLVADGRPAHEPARAGHGPARAPALHVLRRGRRARVRHAPRAGRRRSTSARTSAPSSPPSLAASSSPAATRSTSPALRGSRASRAATPTTASPARASRSGSSIRSPRRS